CIPRDVAHETVDDVTHLRVTGPFVFGAVTNDGVADQLVVGQFVGLVEHAEGDTTATGDATGIRIDASRQQTQQCRFTVAIAHDDADAVALIEPDGEAVEYDTGRVLEVQRLSAK